MKPDTEHTRHQTLRHFSPWSSSTRAGVSAFPVAHEREREDTRERTGTTGRVPAERDRTFDSWEWRAVKFANDVLGVVDEDEEVHAVAALRLIGWPDRFDSVDAALRAAEAALDGPYGRRRCRTTNETPRDRESGRTAPKERAA